MRARTGFDEEEERWKERWNTREYKGEQEKLARYWDTDREPVRLTEAWQRANECVCVCVCVCTSEREENSQSFIDLRKTAVQQSANWLQHCTEHTHTHTRAHSSDDWRQVAAGEPDVAAGWMSGYKDVFLLNEKFTFIQLMLKDLSIPTS